MASFPFRPAASKRHRAYHGGGVDLGCGRNLCLRVVLQVRRCAAPPGFSHRLHGALPGGDQRLAYLGALGVASLHLRLGAAGGLDLSPDVAYDDI